MTRRAPPPSSILVNPRYREALRRGRTIPLAALAIAGLAASASGKNQVGAKLGYDNLHDDLQTSVCELSSCLATGTQTQSAPNGAIVDANVNANQSCLSSCTNQQL